MTDAAIRFAVDAGIATLTLDRAETLNAITGAMIRELIAALDRADADDKVRAVIVTGAGRAFCAGADLSRGPSSLDAGRNAGEAEAASEAGGVLALRLFAMLKPVIGAVNGPAVGLGATMTLPMDVRLAAADARFGFVFVRRGMVPEACSSYFLPRVVGIGRAMEWTLTGRMVTAEEGLAAGLVRSVHPIGTLLAAARDVAREIVDSTAPVSVALTRRMLWHGLGLAHPKEAHLIESHLIAARGGSRDAAEGVAAFLGKRMPVFPDKVSADMPSPLACDEAGIHPQL